MRPHLGPFLSFLAYYMGAPSDQFLRIEYGGPLRSVSSLIMEASLCLFFILYGGPQIISLHTILGPPDHFLRLLYGAPQITFFSYNMGGHLRFYFFHKIYGGLLRSVSPLTIWGPLRLVSVLTIWGPLRSVSVHTFWGPLSDQFFLLLDGPPQVSFFAYYRRPLRSVYSHTICPPPPPSGRFLHLLYVGAPLDKFLRLLYGPPLGLRLVSSLTIWGPPQINFFAYYVGAPSD